MNRLIKHFLARRSSTSFVGAPVGAIASSCSGLRRRHPSSLVARQSGVGLIEVLVAVLVLSIAFLGVAALQAVSLSTSNSAMARSMATISSYSILDAMRADRDNAIAGAYNTTGSGMSFSSCPATGATLSSVQINQWCTQLGNTLGTAAGNSVTINCLASGSCSVAVQFNDNRSGSGGSSTQTVSTAAFL